MDNEVFIPDGQMEDIIESDVEGGDVGVPEDVADVINVIAKQRAKENRRKLWEEKKEWDLSPEHQMQKLEKFKNFNAALGSIAPLLLGAAELAGTGGKSLDATNKFVADQRAYRSTEDARRIQQLKEQEYARNIADKQKRKDTYSKAAGEMMSGTPGIPQDYEYMKPFLDASMQEDPEDAVKLLLQIMKPKAKEGTIPLTRAEQTWLVDKDLGHLIGGDPDAARSVMVQSGKYTVKPKEVKPTGWTDSQWDDYQRKLNMQASTLGTKEDIKGQKEREEAGAEAGMGMDKTVNLFKNLWDRKKEQLGTSGAGVLVGTGKQIAAKARVPGFESTAAFEGQRAETAMALNRIVTGQNRLVKSIYDRLLASLPDGNDTESYARAKLEQSIRNAYGLQKAMRAYGNLTPEEMERIGGSINPDATVTADDEANIQAIMKQVFGESKGGAAKTPSSFPTVTTQEQYNKLKSGTQYREELNGPLFRKP